MASLVTLNIVVFNHEKQPALNNFHGVFGSTHGRTSKKDHIVDPFFIDPLSAIR